MLAPLATLADLTARGVTVSQAEESAVAVYLEVASALVRDAAGSPVSQTTSTLTLVPRDGAVWLPGPPVLSVSAVSMGGVSVTDYRLRNGALTRPCGFQGDVTVTYLHGLPDVPADIVDLVCRLAGQELAALRGGELFPRAVRSERIGDYSVTYADAETGTMMLTNHQRTRLAARFGGGVGVVSTR